MERSPAMMVRMAGWRLEHTYTELPQLFYSHAVPTAVREPRLVAFNRPLATMLGLEPDTLERGEGAAIFAGNVLPDGARPIAQAYAGHQFGHFTALGDGRAILLGEQITPCGDRLDIQLKGAGPDAVLTPAVTGAPRSDRCCGNTSSAKPCTRSAFRPPGAWPW